MRVIVIGAGIAGLSAAIKLQQIGVEVVIIEARNRIGGRVCKASEFDFPIDLGASWIHGINGNPLAAIAEKLNLKLDVTDNPSLTSEECFGIYDEDGNLLDSDMEQNIRSKFVELMDIGKQYMDTLGKDLPLEKVLSLDKEEKKYSKKELQFMDWLKSGIEGWENTNLANLSAIGHYWENENMFNGGDGFVVDGFYNIVKELAQSLKGRTKLFLSQIVQRIDYGERSVCVHTTRGRTFTGDYVICTLPLGVLKSNYVTFTPPLPNWKVSAIKQIGFGLMNKIVLQFPEPFWDPNCNGLGYVSEQRGEFSFFLNLYPVLKKPILVCFVAADFAHLIENWSDEQIITKILGTLNKIYGKQKEIPKPVATKITRWGSDPFSRGSYSYMAYGSGHLDIENISQPVGRLHFAGEATFKPLGFTHGAFLSGLREARRIIEQVIDVNVIPSTKQHTFSQPEIQLAKL